MDDSALMKPRCKERNPTFEEKELEEWILWDTRKRCRQIRILDARISSSDFTRFVAKLPCSTTDTAANLTQPLPPTAIIPAGRHRATNMDAPEEVPEEDSHRPVDQDSHLGPEEDLVGVWHRRIEADHTHPAADRTVEEAAGRMGVDRILPVGADLHIDLAVVLRTDPEVVLGEVVPRLSRLCCRMRGRCCRAGV